MEQNEDVNPSPFSYPGPKPQSRETAIVMLADSAEAAVRGSSERSPAEIDSRVDEVIAERLGEGQLDESDLTLREMNVISESFKATLRGVYHPRLEYPTDPAAADAKPGASKKRARRRSPLSALAAFSVGEDDAQSEDEEATSPENAT